MTTGSFSILSYDKYNALYTSIIKFPIHNIIILFGFRNGRENVRHVIESSNIITDIKKANEEIILGLRKLGGQILKSDPPSQSEIIERAALKKEEVRKKSKYSSTDELRIKIDGSKKSTTLPYGARKMSLGMGRCYL